MSNHRYHDQSSHDPSRFRHQEGHQGQWGTPRESSQRRGSQGRTRILQSSWHPKVCRTSSVPQLQAAFVCSKYPCQSSHWGTRFAHMQCPRNSRNTRTLLIFGCRDLYLSTQPQDAPHLKQQLQTPMQQLLGTFATSSRSQ